MSPAFAPDSPLVQAVESVLRQETAVLTIPEIRRARRRSGRAGAPEGDSQGNL